MKEFAMLIAYAALVWWVGNRIVSGRSEWLDRNALPSQAAKLTLSLVVGWFAAGFSVIFFILLLIWRLVKN